MAREALFAMPDASSLLLSSEYTETLSQSEGFAILRQHLAEHYTYRFCDQHAPLHPNDLNQWVVVRDVLHALLVPIVELFDKACVAALAATQATKLEDLEYAFTGPARSAFVWLQCFLSSEREYDWCYSRGCPACVVRHTLDSEFNVRILYAACLLSDVHYPFTFEGPTLPSFMFFLDLLEKAIAQDELFGSDFYELMQPKAVATRDGVEDLIHQCLDLDALLSQPESPLEASDLAVSPPNRPVMLPPCGTSGMRVKRGKVAKRQLQLKLEEDEWMKRMIEVCYHQLSREQAEEATARSSQHSMDAMLKDSTTLTVTEIVPA